MTVPHLLRRAWQSPAAAVAALVLAGGACLGADTVVSVSQRDRAFTVSSVVVPLGGILRLENDDEFVHQIYINEPTMTYESDEQEPGQTIDVHFARAGTFEVRCHIHPRMVLQVTVK